MLLAITFQQQSRVSFNTVLNQLTQLLDSAAHDLLFCKGHKLAMPPEEALKKKLWFLSTCMHGSNVDLKMAACNVTTSKKICKTTKKA